VRVGAAGLSLLLVVVLAARQHPHEEQ